MKSFLFIFVFSVAIPGVVRAVEPPQCPAKKPVDDTKADHRETSRPPQIAVFFVENKYIEGITDRIGFRVGEGGGDLVYKHKKPALIASPETVQNFTLSSKDLSDVSPGTVSYNFILHFTSDARKKFAKTLDGKGTHSRDVTAMIGTRRFGMQRYHVTSDGPEMCRAESFSLIFTSYSKPEALKIINLLLLKETLKSSDRLQEKARPAESPASFNSEESAAIKWVKSVDGRIQRVKMRAGPGKARKKGPIEFVGLGRGAGSDPDAIRVNDEGLKHLVAFPQLRKLGLGTSPQVTSKGIKGLKELPKLIDLSYTPRNKDCVQALSLWQAANR